jgi:hypothetical protein
VHNKNGSVNISVWADNPGKALVGNNQIKNCVELRFYD